MTDIRLKISPPWITHIHMIQALFDGDPQIACNVGADEGGEPFITLACNNGDKVTALQQILPTEVMFGNIPLHIAIDGIPSNRAFVSKKELFEVAFAKNPAFAYAVAPADDGYNWFGMGEKFLLEMLYKECTLIQMLNVVSQESLSVNGHN